MTLLATPSAVLPFRHPEGALGMLGAGQAAGVVSAASDITLVIDSEGRVRDRSVSSGELVRQGIGDWLDQSWIDTVTSESRFKVSEMLDAAKAGQPSRWRELNHPGEDGGTVPVRYFALGAGDAGDVVVVGRDLQPDAALQQRLMQVQQSVERDYLRLRQAEGRYRLLFQTASEAVLILDTTSRRIREANPAASRMTGLEPGALNGRPFNDILDAGSVAPAAGLFDLAATSSVPSQISVRIKGEGEAVLSASMFRHDQSTALLVRLSPIEVGVGQTGDQSALAAVLERIPDAFVVTDGDLRILTVNPAFVELAHLANREEATNLPLGQFLGRSGVDLRVIAAQLRDHGVVRNFATTLRARYGEAEPVEVAAVQVPDGDRPCLGFSIRNVARRPAPQGVGNIQSVEQLTRLIGRVPMKDIVRESTDLIEKLCIEAALKLTSDNRASAADVLGLSRQSLYLKLRRYGLGGLEDEPN